MKLSMILKTIASCTLLSLSSLSQAAWPERPINLVIPFPPGGATDIVGRLVAKELSDRLNTTVVVENRAGAAGNIGSRHVAKSKPDGYTLLIGTTAQSISAATYKDPGYDFVNDFESISTINDGPLLLLAKPNLKANNVKELIELAKQNPGTITFATPGYGSSAHMAAEVFNLKAGTKMVHIPYTGAAPAMNDLMSGQVDIAFDLILSAKPFVDSNKVKILGIATKDKYALEPSWPTLAEQNPEILEGFHETAWNILMAPKGTSSEIVNKLNELMKDILASESVLKKLTEMRNVAVWKTPEESAQFIENDVAKWKDVVRDANIQQQ